MITLERTVTTNRPADQVFAYLADFTHAVEWDSGTVSCTRGSGDGGVGTSYQNVSKFLGRETELTYVTQALEPTSRFVIRGENKAVISDDTISLRSIDAGTEVTYTAKFTFKGLAKLAEPLMRRPLNKLGDETEQTLTTALNRI